MRTRVVKAEDRQWLLRLITVVLIFCIGCRKSKAQCEAEADDLMTYLRTLDLEGSLFQVSETMHLVPRPNARKPKAMAPVVVMETKLTSYQGQAVADLAELGERLRAARQKVYQGIEDPTLLYFEIDGAVTWDRVAPAVDAASDAGFTHVSFVVGLTAAAPPPHTWVDDKLAGAHATDVAKIAEGIVASCPALRKVFGQVAGEEGGNRAGQLVEDMGPAILECRCDLDIPALRSVMYGILGNKHPTGVVDVQVAKSAPQLTFAATTPWSEASRQLQQSQLVWFAAP